MGARLRKRACARCGKLFSFRSLSDHAFAPFCSERCKTIDLGAWLSEEYAVVERLPLDETIGGLAAIDDPDVRAALEELNQE
ncbi:MAG: DNA gyrase inhibitor YacG [Nitrospira sp.]|nr:DNA gyrase inhibitor YacG [Nitrospira sp.]